MSALNFENSQSLSVSFVLDVCIAKSKKIFLFPLIAMTIAFSMMLFMPKWYKSTAVILIPDKTTNPLDILTGSVASLGSSVLGLGKTGNERYIAILNSRRLRTELINKYNLMVSFGDEDISETDKRIARLIDITVDKKTGAIEVSFEFFGNAQLTAEMTNFIVETLDRINQEISVEQARSSRIFIEKRYNQAKLDLRLAEDSLNAFQNTFGVVEISGQTEVSIKAVAEVYAQIVNTETEYNVLRKSMGESHPTVQQIKAKLDELRNAQSKIEFGKNNFDALIPFKKTPDLALKYYRFYRDVQINGKILEFLVPQLEQAKIQEARDTPTILLLDNATPANKHSSPKKLIISLIIGFITFIICLMFFIGREFLRLNPQLSTDKRLSVIKILFGIK